MKFFATFIVLACLFFSPIFGDFGIGLGPFSLSIGGDSPGYYPSNRMQVNDPFCYAISAQKRVELVAQNREVVSPKEMKLVTKKLIFEPYAFGFSQDRKPILQGNIVEEKLVKEVSIKYGEDQFKDNMTADQNQPKKGFFSGIFHSRDKTTNGGTIAVQQITDINVLDNSHFDLPKDIGNGDQFAQIICRVPAQAKAS